MDKRQLFTRVAVTATLLATGGPLFAQTPATAGWGGIGDPSEAPGDPASSYALNSVDHVNYYTGSVNVVIPIQTFGGRGNVAKTTVVPIQRQWGVYAGAPQAGLWTAIYGFYTGGSIYLSTSSPNPTYCYNSAANAYYGNQATSYISFTAFDGSQTILTDTTYGGQPKDPNGSCQPADRGTVFRSTEGSGMMFVANADVHDGDGYVQGTLITRDGTKYTFSSDTFVNKIEDRNGNIVQFLFSSTSGGGLYTVTDPIGRNPTINFTEYPLYDSQDVITYPGYNNAARTIKVNYALLQSALASGESLQTYSALFPTLAGSSSSQFNPYVISSVVLADNTSYTMAYNSYGELTKLTLPTGAVIGYKYGEAYAGGASGAIALADGINYKIVRPLVERDEYADGSNLSAKMLYSATGGNSGSRPNLEATVKFEDPSGNLLRQENHYFYGNPLSTAPPPADNTYADWWEGLEYQTDVTDGSNTLQSTQRVYQQRPWATGENPWFPLTGPFSDAQPLHDPQMCQLNTTLGSSGASGSVFFFDQYNNVTDQYDFDYGAAPGVTGSCPTGPFTTELRDTKTTYFGGYTAPGTNLVSLPSEVKVYDGASVLYSDTKFSYDGTSAANAPNLTTGHDNVNYGFGVAASRGNLTSISQYLNYPASTWLTSTLSYDIAGNLVGSTDANNHSTTYSYSDNYADGTNRWSYGMLTSVTNAVGQASTVQYDYYTSKPTTASDANGAQTAYAYNDLLDRLTGVRNAAGTSVEARTGYSYVAPTVLVTGQDLMTTGDQGLTSEQYADGFGRTKTSYMIENPSNWGQNIETDTTYDALGRVIGVQISFKERTC